MLKILFNLNFTKFSNFMNRLTFSVLILCQILLILNFLKKNIQFKFLYYVLWNKNNVVISNIALILNICLKPESVDINFYRRGRGLLSSQMFDGGIGSILQQRGGRVKTLFTLFSVNPRQQPPPPPPQYIFFVD